MATSTPGRGRPQVFGLPGLAEDISGVLISVMLNSVKTSTPNRSWNAGPLAPRGTMMTCRSPCSRSSGLGGCFSRKVAIDPSRKADVTSSVRTLSQKMSVLKAATTPIDPPTHSAVLATNAPPMWKIGM